MQFERGPGLAAGLRGLVGHLNGATFSSAFAAWLFAIAGPTVLVLNTAAQLELPRDIVTSWIFGLYATGGAMTLFMSLYYGQPIAGAFAVPGILLVAQALQHLSFAEVVGAYVMAGVIIFALGATGVIHRVMQWLPMPVMMGMVAAVLLPIALNIVRSVEAAPAMAGATLAAFVVVTMLPAVARKLPPILAAILAGLAAATWLGEASWTDAQLALARPRLFAPSFTLAALTELAVPLALTTIAVQNPQGVAALRAMGYRPPLAAMTVLTGAASVINGFLGASTACIAGPSTAIIASESAGPKEGRYAAGVWLAVLWLGFALVAPVAASLTGIIPMPVIQMLGGLALVPVLTAFFAEAFGGRFRLGSLAAFMITLSDVALWGIGAPFWGLVGGTLVSMTLERADFAALLNYARQAA